MAKEPWEEKIVDDTIGTRTRKSRNAFISTPWLTALLSVFFVIIVAILFIFFYTSNSGSIDKLKQMVFMEHPLIKKQGKLLTLKKHQVVQQLQTQHLLAKKHLLLVKELAKPLLYWQVRGQLLLQPVQVFLWSSYKHLIQST